MRARLLWLFHFVAPVCDGTNTSSAGRSHLLPPRAAPCGLRAQGLWYGAYRAVNLSRLVKKINPCRRPGERNQTGSDKEFTAQKIWARTIPEPFSPAAIFG